MPSCSMSLGYMLMGVKPGSVLGSLSITSPSPWRTKKSILVRPAQPSILYALTARFFIRATVIRVNVDVRCTEESEKFDMIQAIKNFMKNRAAIGQTAGACAAFISMYGAQAASAAMFQS